MTTNVLFQVQELKKSQSSQDRDRKDKCLEGWRGRQEQVMQACGIMTKILKFLANERETTDQLGQLEQDHLISIFIEI